MNMLKSLVLCAAVLGGAAHAEEKPLKVYNWFDYITPKALEDFKAQHPQVKLVYDIFDTNEALEAKLLTGNSGYDVVVPSNVFLAKQIEAGVFQALDRSQLPNWNHLDPKLMKLIEANDPGNKFAVPYMYGTILIGFNPAKVKAVLGDNAPVDSWDLIFKEENISKLKSCGVAMLDSPSEIISIALHYLGLPSNSQNPEDYQKAQALLLKIRPYVLYFDSSRTDADFADGNICVVVGWASGALTAQAINEKNNTGRKIAYSLPREGGLVWSENFVLLKDAPNAKAGLAFINYMLEPEVIAKSSNHTLYPNANKDATALVEQKLRDNPWIYPSKATIATLVPLEPLPLKLERIRTRVWTKVKSGT